MSHAISNLPDIMKNASNDIWLWWKNWYQLQVSLLNTQMQPPSSNFHQCTNSKWLVPSQGQGQSYTVSRLHSSYSLTSSLPTQSARRLTLTIFQPAQRQPKPECSLQGTYVSPMRTSYFIRQTDKETDSHACVECKGTTTLLSTSLALIVDHQGDRKCSFKSDKWTLDLPINFHNYSLIYRSHWTMSFIFKCSLNLAWPLSIDLGYTCFLHLPLRDFSETFTYQSLIGPDNHTYLYVNNYRLITYRCDVVLSP